MMFLKVMAATFIWVGSGSPMLIAVGWCGFVVLAVLFAASRGKLHIPGYVGLALVSFAVAFICGRISGAHSVRGTRSGEILSIVFFLLIAVAVGSVLGIFFYRDPPERKPDVRDAVAIASREFMPQSRTRSFDTRLFLGVLALCILVSNLALFYAKRDGLPYRDFKIFYSGARILRADPGTELYNLDLQARVQTELLHISVRGAALQSSAI